MWKMWFCWKGEAKTNTVLKAVCKRKNAVQIAFLASSDIRNNLSHRPVAQTFFLVVAPPNFLFTFWAILLMTHAYRSNPALLHRLRMALTLAEETALSDLLLSLSKAEQKAAGACLATELLPTMTDGEQFAALFASTVRAHPRATLGTFLKAAIALYQKGILLFPSEGLERYAQSELSAIDRRKIFEALLPLIKDEAAAQWFFRTFAPSEVEASMLLLVRIPTALAAYLLFSLFQQHEDDTALLRKISIELLKRGDRLAFNLASITQQYFDLPALPATFSLTLSPYQFSRIEKGYSGFAELLLSI